MLTKALLGQEQLQLRGGRGYVATLQCVTLQKESIGMLEHLPTGPASVS